jgi:hypothetical protein
MGYIGSPTLNTNQDSAYAPPKRPLLEFLRGNTSYGPEVMDTIWNVIKQVPKATQELILEMVGVRPSQRVMEGIQNPPAQMGLNRETGNWVSGLAVDAVNTALSSIPLGALTQKAGRLLENIPQMLGKADIPNPLMAELYRRASQQEANTAGSGAFSSRWDKVPRVEIPDNGMAFIPDSLPRNPFNEKLYSVPVFPKKEYVLSDIIRHPELFNAAPSAKAVPIKSTGFSFGTLGAYDPDKDVMRLMGSEPENMLKTANHELQHRLQTQGEMASGGNTQMFLPEDFNKAKKNVYNQIQDLHKELRDKIEGYNGIEAEWNIMGLVSGDKRIYGDKTVWEKVKSNPEISKLSALLYEKKQMDDLEYDAFKNYKNLAGEFEARDSAARMGLTPEQRVTTPPYSSENIPLEELIVREGGK